MRCPALLTLTLLAALTACSEPPRQQAEIDSCRQFALSGGYPYLRGGPTYGPNSTIEQLPGAPPLMLRGLGEDDVKAHLDEEEYLENWCRQNR
jgi:hypothetical protein